MARSVPLTESRADAVMRHLHGMLLRVGERDDTQVGERLISSLWGHKPAFISLAKSSSDEADRVIAAHRRRDIFAEFLPVIDGAELAFNFQCDDLRPMMRFRTRWLDSEVGSDGNGSGKFVLRKLPHVALCSSQPTRLIHLMQFMDHERIKTKANMWDVLAVLRSCRERLPAKCVVCISNQQSWIIPRYGRRDESSPQPRSYIAFFLEKTRTGSWVDIRQVSENTMMPIKTIFLDYVATTVDLRA